MEKIFEDFKAAVKSSGARIYKSGIEEKSIVNGIEDIISTSTKIWVSVRTSNSYNEDIILKWFNENGYGYTIDKTEKTIIYSININKFALNADCFGELDNFVVDLVNNKYKDRLCEWASLYKELFEKGHNDLKIYHPFKEVLLNVFKDINNSDKFSGWAKSDVPEDFDINDFSCLDDFLPEIYSAAYDDFYAEVRYKLEEYFYFDTEDTDLMYIESYNK